MKLKVNIINSLLCWSLLISPMNVNYYPNVSFINNSAKTFFKSDLNYTIFNNREYSLEHLLDDSDNYHLIKSSEIETTKKKLIISIMHDNKNFRYKVELIWKSMPKVRGYDIIGIGFFKTVKVKSPIKFIQEYCYLSGGCQKSTMHYPQLFSSGIGTIFKVQSGNLYSLKQTLYFDVEKNTKLDLFSQTVYGDYAHSIENINLLDSSNYVVNSLGIVLDSKTIDLYDEIGMVETEWVGKW